MLGNSVPGSMTDSAYFLVLSLGTFLVQPTQSCPFRRFSLWMLKGNEHVFSWVRTGKDPTLPSAGSRDPRPSLTVTVGLGCSEWVFEAGLKWGT